MKKLVNEDPMKHYRTEHSANGNIKFKLTLTIKLIWKKEYLHHLVQWSLQYANL